MAKHGRERILGCSVDMCRRIGFDLTLPLGCAGTPYAITCVESDDGVFKHPTITPIRGSQGAHNWPTTCSRSTLCCTALTPFRFRCRAATLDILTGGKRIKLEAPRAILDYGVSCCRCGASLSHLHHLTWTPCAQTCKAELEDDVKYVIKFIRSCRNGQQLAAELQSRLAPLLALPGTTNIRWAYNAAWLEVALGLAQQESALHAALAQAGQFGSSRSCGRCPRCFSLPSGGQQFACWTARQNCCRRSSRSTFTTRRTGTQQRHHWKHQRAAAAGHGSRLAERHAHGGGERLRSPPAGS